MKLREPDAGDDEEGEVDASDNDDIVEAGCVLAEVKPFVLGCIPVGADARVVHPSNGRLGLRARLRRERECVCVCV
jgi:hypothetical protein